MIEVVENKAARMKDGQYDDSCTVQISNQGRVHITLGDTHFSPPDKFGFFDLDTSIEFFEKALEILKNKKKELHGEDKL